MILLCRTIGRSAAAAWVAAVSYAFSGVAVAEVFFPHIQPGMTLLPVDPLGRGARPAPSRLSRFAGAGRALRARPPGRRRLHDHARRSSARRAGSRSRRIARAQLRSAGGLAAAIGVAALAAAPQIVATLLWIPLTNRARRRDEALRRLALLDSSLAPARARRSVPFGPAMAPLDRATCGASRSFTDGHGSLRDALRGRLRGDRRAPIAWRSARARRAVSRGPPRAGLALLTVDAPEPSCRRAGQSRTSPLPLRNPEKFAVAVVLALALSRRDRVRCLAAPPAAPGLAARRRRCC